MSHPVWLVTWCLPHCLFVLESRSVDICYLPVSGVIQTFCVLSFLFLLQHISKWAAFSGCGRDAPGCPTGGGGGRIMVELSQPEEVMDITSHSMENDRLSFLINTSLQKHFRECTKIHLISTHRKSPKRSRDWCFLVLKLRTVLIVTAVDVIGPFYLHCPALRTFVSTLGRCN